MISAIVRQMHRVRVIVCPRCNGLGVVGLGDFSCQCPRCAGCGESTNGVYVEEAHRELQTDGR